MLNPFLFRKVNCFCGFKSGLMSSYTTKSTSFTIVTSLIYFELIIPDTKFLELENVNFDLAVEAGVIHKMFNGLQWITASYSNDPEKEIKKIIEIKDYINSDTSKKIIISDYQFFSAISINKINTLIKWNKWYDSASSPARKNKYFGVKSDGRKGLA